MANRHNRRSFLAQTAASSAALAAAWHVNPGPAAASNSSLEKLNIAAIGTGNRAAANIKGCSSQNITALADVDSNFLAAACATYKDARRYRDFRDLLETEGVKIDAVIVATPDHTHAPAAAMAMRMGRHTYCEKPLTHTVFEARRLAELAAEKKLVTQMGTQIHAGENYRRVVEVVKSGTIGQVREVHVWVGVDYSGGRLMKKPQPSGIDWDLWLGPAAQSDYVEATINGEHQTVHPFHWRCSGITAAADWATSAVTTWIWLTGLWTSGTQRPCPRAGRSRTTKQQRPELSSTTNTRLAAICRRSNSRGTTAERNRTCCQTTRQGRQTARSKQRAVVHRRTRRDRFELQHKSTPAERRRHARTSRPVHSKIDRPSQRMDRSHQIRRNNHVQL